MDLDLGPEIAEYRAGLRAWIEAEAPAALAGLFDWNAPQAAGNQSPPWNLPPNSSRL